MKSTPSNFGRRVALAALTAVIGMTAIVGTALSAIAPPSHATGNTPGITSNRLGSKGIGDIPPESPSPPPSLTLP